MKKVFIFLAVALLSVSSLSARNHAKEIVAEIKNPKSKTVLVASHRGDWRNYPENSLAAMESVIKMGVDILELDLALTKDSVLVVCHDRTIDRTTTGKGLIKNITADSIARCFLKTGHNVATSHKMPTLREALLLCKDRIVVNIDKGYQYYDLVIKLTDELGVTDQMLIKGNKPRKQVRKKLSAYPHKMLYMPIISYYKKDAESLFDSYIKAKKQPVAYEFVWKDFSPTVQDAMKQVIASGSKVWVNTLWPSFNCGLCDDAAFDGDPAKIYGRLLEETGATMIQTDRPQLLLDYLRSIGRHK